MPGWYVAEKTRPDATKIPHFAICIILASQGSDGFVSHLLACLLTLLLSDLPDGLHTDSLADLPVDPPASSLLKNLSRKILHFAICIILASQGSDGFFSHLMVCLLTFLLPGDLPDGLHTDSLADLPVDPPASSLLKNLPRKMFFFTVHALGAHFLH